MHWFESNGSHRHLRVTLLLHWLKVACGAFSGVRLSGFDRRRLKRVGFSREVSRRYVEPFADTDLTLYE